MMKIIVEKARITAIWKNIVKVWAADSAVNRKDVTYVNGRMPNGKATKIQRAVSNSRSKTINRTIVAPIVMYNFIASTMKLAIQYDKSRIPATS